MQTRATQPPNALWEALRGCHNLQNSKNGRPKPITGDGAHQPADVVARSAAQRVQCIAGGALQPAAVHAVVGLGVTDGTCSRGSSTGTGWGEQAMEKPGRPRGCAQQVSRWSRKQPGACTGCLRAAAADCSPGVIACRPGGLTPAPVGCQVSRSLPAIGGDATDNCKTAG